MTQKAQKTQSQSKHENILNDPIALGQAVMSAMVQIQPLWQDYVRKQGTAINKNNPGVSDITHAYQEWLNGFISDPQQAIKTQMEFWQQWGQVWQHSIQDFLNNQQKNDASPLSDKRFSAQSWQESALFNFIKQTYLLNSQTTINAIHQMNEIDDETKKKLEFYTRQYVDAMAPSNFAVTNPEVIDETIRSGGENLIRGFKNLIRDLERGKGSLNISTTDFSAFELGKNIACTKGKVIYQNDLIQLIQYEPSTKTVHETPLLIVPPWINKYYILDLQPQNSLIKYMVDQGHTVFTISWVNPDASHASKTFEDYMQEGILTALEQIKATTDQEDCHALGYCIGGTLLATSMAYMAKNKQDINIASATFLTTLLDFSNSGEVSLFLDNDQLSAIEDEMQKNGFLSGDYLKTAFSLLRANDMIWSFFVNNYLLGRDPFAFDILYWNDDSTNMAAATHKFYLENFYKNNNLIKPNSIKIKDTPIDIGKIEAPCYFLSTKEDHIAPWQSTYSGTQLLLGSKDKTFILAAAGHVAGVVNPPTKNKYCFWENKDLPDNAQTWFDNATQTDGSWWLHWQNWLSKKSGSQTAARIIKKSIEDAPGSYVKKKA